MSRELSLGDLGGRKQPKHPALILVFHRFYAGFSEAFSLKCLRKSLFNLWKVASVPPSASCMGRTIDRESTDGVLRGRTDKSVGVTKRKEVFERRVNFRAVHLFYSIATMNCCFNNFLSGATATQGNRGHPLRDTCSLANGMPRRQQGDLAIPLPDELSRTQIFDLYKLAFDEYRFEIRLNWDRSMYYITFNTGLVAAGAGLLKLGDNGAVDLFIAGIFLLGCFSSMMGILALRKATNIISALSTKRP
jgi:hypothetical protein